MLRWFRTASLAGVLAMSPMSYGCVVCHSEVGHQVREGILNGDFFRIFLSTVAPFPIFLGAVAYLYCKLPVPEMVPARDVNSTYADQNFLTGESPL